MTKKTEAHLNPIVHNVIYLFFFGRGAVVSRQCFVERKIIINDIHANYARLYSAYIGVQIMWLIYDAILDNYVDEMKVIKSEQQNII